MTKWKQFKIAIADLQFDTWSVSDEKELSDILSVMIDGIANSSSVSVDEYFVKNDFEKDCPFKSFDLKNDLKCRIIERKIKLKLILDGAAVESKYRVPVGDWRWGILYYICGFLSSWGYW